MEESHSRKLINPSILVLTLTKRTLSRYCKLIIKERAINFSLRYKKHVKITFDKNLSSFKLIAERISVQMAKKYVFKIFNLQLRNFFEIEQFYEIAPFHHLLSCFIYYSFIIANRFNVNRIFSVKLWLPLQLWQTLLLSK